jgi:hypothetical protein
MACLLIPARSASVQGQLLEAGGVELLDEPALDRLGRHAQQGADQQVFRGNGGR